MADPARARMLTALLGGLALPAGDLARSAGVRPATASGHLRVLLEADLVRVSSSGRHRYYRLAGTEVASAVEALSRLAPVPPVTSLREHRISRELRSGRTCYDHLAGDLGMRVTGLLQTAGVIPELEPGVPVVEPERLPDHPMVTDLDLVATLLGSSRRGRRIWARGCLDWSCRRPHVAGRLAAQVLDGMLGDGLVRRRPEGRAVHLTAEGEAMLLAWQGGTTAVADRPGRLRAGSSRGGAEGVR